MKRSLPTLLALACLSSPAAQAAESYDNCSGFIDSVPATITTQGVWCLRADLSTAVATGFAIDVATNNVTIDCNQFKLGGLAAGAATLTLGIRAVNRANVAVRNCSIRGFRIGVALSNGSGYIVEDSRFDGNTTVGIYVWGYGSMVRRNLVLDTGGNEVNIDYANGIYAYGGASIHDNLIDGVIALGTNRNAFGIRAELNDQASITRNHVGNIYPSGTGTRYGIAAVGGRVVMRENTVMAGGSATGHGILCTQATQSAVNNVVSGFQNGITACPGTGNYINSNN